MRKLKAIVAFSAVLATFAAAAEIKVGIIGLDTSHATAFTRHLNQGKERPIYNDFRVTHAVVKGSL